MKNNLNGADLASFTISPEEVSTSEINEIYKKLSNPVRLNAGGDYYLVFSTGQSDSRNSYWLYDLWDSGDWYAEGSEYQWDGSSWLNYTNGDFCFETNDNPIPHADNEIGRAHV